jgi:hypothetical protein
MLQMAAFDASADLEKKKRSLYWYLFVGKSRADYD